MSEECQNSVLGETLPEESGVMRIEQTTMVLDSLTPNFPERYREARSCGLKVIVDPFTLVYRLGWDPNQEFLLRVLEECCSDLELSKLRDDEGFDLLGRYLLDAAYGAARRTRGKNAILNAETISWFVERGLSLQRRYTDRQVAGYEDKFVGRVFHSDNESGQRALSLIEAANHLDIDDPWLQRLRVLTDTPRHESTP